MRTMGVCLGDAEKPYNSNNEPPRTPKPANLKPKRQNSAKTRKKKRGGNITAKKIGENAAQNFGELKMVGELRKILQEKNPGKYIKIVYGPYIGARELEDSENFLVKDVFYRAIDILSPSELAKYILKAGYEYTDLDYFLIDRKLHKFAASASGSQGPAITIIKYSILSYTPEERKELLDLLETHFKFEIEYCEEGTTFYDKEVANILLGLFQKNSLLADFSNVCDVLKSDNTPYKMKYIYILFGEVQHVPGAEEPFFTTRTKPMTSTPNIFYNDLEPELQKIIVDLNTIIDAKLK
jgi:hypothetical protein